MSRLKFCVTEMKTGRIIEKGMSFKAASELASDLNDGEGIFKYVVVIDEEVNICR